LLLLAGLAVVGPFMGMGFYSAFHQEADAIDAESEEEIAFLEVPGEVPAVGSSTHAKATLTDVVAAVHQEIPGDREQTVIQIAGERPASNPSAWLAGTIEDAIEPDPPVSTNESALRGFDRFNRSSAR
jgi:hypothetical protein